MKNRRPRRLFEDSGWELERRRLLAYAPVAEIQWSGSGSEPQAVTAPDGVTTIVWADRGGGGDLGGVYGRRVDREGRPLDAQFRINDDPQGAGSGPMIGVDARGGVVVAWRDSWSGRPDHTRLLVQRFDAQGTKLGENRLLLNEPDLANTSDFHVLPDGGFCIVAAGGDGVDLYMRFDAEGRPLAGDRLDDLIAEGWRSAGSGVNVHSAVAEGVMLVVWSEYRTRVFPDGRHVSDGRSWVRRLALDGRRLGDDVLIASVQDARIDHVAFSMAPSVFGPHGLWRWSGRFERLTTADPQGLAIAADGTLTIDFGGFGLWSRTRAGFSKIHEGNALALVAARDGLVYVHLGRAGVWRRGPAGTLELVDASGTRRIFG